MPTTVTRTKWFLPLCSLGLGIVYLVAFWLGGEPGAGLGGLGVMAALAALLLLGGRSETVRGLRGDGRDERFRLIDLEATAAAGMTLVAAVLVMGVWEFAHGRDGSPYTQLGALAGAAYVVAVAVFRRRR